MWAIIPAAGKGTRLSTAAPDPPKCLLAVGGESLLQRLISDVASVASGICVVIPPRDESGELVERAATSSAFDTPLTTVTQHVRAGVADAVLQCEDVVDGPFVVIMGDVYYELAIAPHIAALSATPPPAVLVEPVTAPSRDPAGVVTVEDGRVTSIEKRPLDGTERFRVAGAFAFPEGAFDAFRAARPPTGEFELEQVMRVLMEAGTVGTVVYEGWRKNVNTPEDLRTVRRRSRRTGTGKRRPRGG